MYQSAFPISFDKLIMSCPKSIPTTHFVGQMKKQPKLDVSLHSSRFTIYSLIFFPICEIFDWLFKDLWAYLPIITYLNITKAFILLTLKTWLGNYMSQLHLAFEQCPCSSFWKCSYWFSKKCSVNTALFYFNKFCFSFLE